MKLRNISPLGDIDVLRRHVPAGAVFEVTDEQGARLLEQPANYELATEAPTAKEAKK